MVCLCIFVVSRRFPDQVLANITVGFEPVQFYRDWIKGDGHDVDALKGPALMPMTSQSKLAPALLRLIGPYLSGDRLDKFRRHYFMFKDALSQFAADEDE